MDFPLGIKVRSNHGLRHRINLPLAWCSFLAGLCWLSWHFSISRSNSDGASLLSIQSRVGCTLLLMSAFNRDLTRAAARYYSLPHHRRHWSPSPRKCFGMIPRDMPAHCADGTFLISEYFPPSLPEGGGGGAPIHDLTEWHADPNTRGRYYCSVTPSLLRGRQQAYGILADNSLAVSMSFA